ncbi:MAG TPA: glycosyltransferase family 4 protein [Allosphingosinicella sp.]|jgi:glycosyltransferase involved in cell wall biosynthesis
MQPRSIVISINASWNIVNFRLGLIRALQADGHRVIALAPDDAYSRRLAKLGIEYRGIEMDKKGLSPLADLRLLRSYRRILRELGPDLFLGYTAKPNIYGSLAAHSLGMRVINNVSGLGTAFIRGGWLLRIVSMLYRRAFRRSARVFFQNPEDRDLFVAKRLVRPDQTGLLPGSGIDLSRFSPPPDVPRDDGDAFRFLLVGRVIRDKGILEYVEAARRLRPRWPDVKFQLLGFVDAENRTAISKDIVDGWVAEGLIDYLGAADDVRPFVAAADCVVLPSYREGLPRTLLEAAAMARPLIATDVPGCRHLVRDGVNGLLCEVRDADALAAAMERMLGAAPEQRAAWGAEARAIAEREFSEEVVIARYRDAIAEAFA